MYPYVTRMLPVSVYPYGVLVKILGRKITRLPKLSISWATDGTKLLVKSVCETKPKSSFLVWAPTCVPGQLANQDDGKLETHFR